MLDRLMPAGGLSAGRYALSYQRDYGYETVTVTGDHDRIRAHALAAMTADRHRRVFEFAMK